MEISNNHSLPSHIRDASGIGGRGEAPASAPAKPAAAQANPVAKPDNATVAPPLSAITNMIPAQEADQAKAAEKAKAKASDNQLTPEQQETVQELKKIDAEVRAHERAHKTAGGSLAGQATYTYVQGPDGQQYAVSGEVAIDSGTSASPRETIRKMEIVIRAAMAPANPSSQDQSVAAAARQTIQKAQSQLAKEEAEKENQQTPPAPSANDPQYKNGIAAYAAADAAFGVGLAANQNADQSTPINIRA